MIILTVTTATPVVHESGGAWSVNTPMTVAAVPGSGGTLLVETQTAPGGRWFPWSEGTDGVVSVPTQMKLGGKVHAIRLTAADADGVVELGY
jgi:hypothetical protein